MCWVSKVTYLPYFGRKRFWPSTPQEQKIKDRKERRTDRLIEDSFGKHAFLTAYTCTINHVYVYKFSKTLTIAKYNIMPGKYKDKNETQGKTS